MLLREQLAGAAKPGLDFVEDQHHVMRGAESAYLGEIARWWNDDAGFALDWVDQESDGVRRNRRFQRLGVREGNDLKARRERSEMVARRRVCAEADDAKGASVEVVGADDDLGLPIRHALHLIA